MNQTQQIIHSICHAHTQDKEQNMYEEVFYSSSYGHFRCSYANRVTHLPIGVFIRTPN